jgi:hypothetical protein
MGMRVKIMRSGTGAGLAALLCLQACFLQIEKRDLLVPDASIDDAADEIEEELPTAAVEEVCRAIFDLLCGFFNTCCAEDEISNLYIFDLVIAVGFDCAVPAASTMYRDCVEGATDALNRGTMSINVAAVPACTSALNALGGQCRNAGDFMAAYSAVLTEHCGTVWQGLVAENESCSFEDECSDGLYCDASGWCLPAVEPGGMCSYDDQCGEDMACLPGGYCGSPGELGQPCDDDMDCVLPLFCHPDTNMCTALLDAGASCITGASGCKGLCQANVCVNACR